jgi:zinc protease
MTIAPRLARTLLPAALLLAAISSVPARATDTSIYDPKKITTPAIGKIPAVKPERFMLPNGVVVYLLESHDLPVVRGVAYFACSPTFTPADRAGLPGLTGEVMRSGGTAAHPGDWLDDRLAAIGAAVNANVAPTLANTGFRCLSENTAEVVGLWTEVTRQPAFPDEKIELAKVGLRRSISSRNDEMMGILFRAASQAVYGTDSPWARQPEYATVEPIAKADCQKLHGEVFVPERMIVAIYGDFKLADMKALLTAKLADWKKSGTAKPELPPTPASVTPRIVFAPKDDVTQSGIIVAQPGSRCSDPDYAAMTVLEQALGGGFSSRMFSHIRTQRGLAYATGAQAGADYERPGVFMAYSLTQSESTLTALDLVKGEVRRITEAPLTPEELEIAKQAVVNGYVFNFADPSQTLFRAAYYEAVGYPADFLQSYQKSLDAVSAQSVLDAAHHKITPDAQVVIIVGKEKDFEHPLASTGMPVERMDITIPPPPSKLGKVSMTPAAKQQGGKWLADAAAAAGGAKAWAAVHSFTSASEATVSMMGQSMSLTGTESWRFPDHKAETQKMPFGEITQGFDGTTGWMSAMGQLQDNPKAAEDVAKDWERSLWRLFSDPAKVELSALEAPEVVDGVSYRAAVMVGAKTQDLVVLFTEDGKLAGFAYHSEGGGQMPPARAAELLSGWSAEGALQYPHAMRTLRDGKPFMESKVTSLQLNPTLADAIFKKPAK